jgi:arylamine N-acetyltransferase
LAAIRGRRKNPPIFFGNIDANTATIHTWIHLPECRALVATFTFIPFENLDIHQGKKIVLEENRIYEKIVINGRGGFCFELNGLFCWLLRSLGFSVSMVSSQVYRSAEDMFTPQFDHMVLLVNLEKAYLVDVGFGDTFRNPIALPDGIVEDISGTYRVQPFGSAPDKLRNHFGIQLNYKKT